MQGLYHLITTLCTLVIHGVLISIGVPLLHLQHPTLGDQEGDYHCSPGPHGDTHHLYHRLLLTDQNTCQPCECLPGIACIVFRTGHPTHHALPQHTGVGFYPHIHARLTLSQHSSFGMRVRLYQGHHLKFQAENWKLLYVVFHCKTELPLLKDPKMYYN